MKTVRRVADVSKYYIPDELMLLLFTDVYKLQPKVTISELNVKRRRCQANTYVATALRCNMVWKM